MYEFRLYVVGGSRSSSKAVGDLESLLKDSFESQYSLKVIDILENPERAKDDKVFATPTVVKVLPPPVRKIVGDFSDRERILIALDL